MFLASEVTNQTLVRWIVYEKAFTILYRIATKLKVGRQVVLISVDHAGLDLQSFRCSRVSDMLRRFSKGRHALVLGMLVGFRD